MDTSNHRPSPHIAILMGTYNGEAYLSEQLDSIEQQHYPHWTLHVSDDSPTPGTQKLLKVYQQRWGATKLVIYQGKQQGFATNFMSLVRNTAIHSHYYAFADQDDRWHPENSSGQLNNWRLKSPTSHYSIPPERGWWMSRASQPATRRYTQGHPPSKTPWCKISPAVTRWCLTKPPATT